MRTTLFLSVAICFAFSFVSNVEAHPVINEVMWPGSDLSSSDEWFELTLSDCDTQGASCQPVDMTGYTVTYLKSTGVETLMLTFPANFILQPNEYLVIANNTSANSRLLSEPALISTALTLANSGLRLRLKDSNGIVIDEVDDGVGVPFAGANPSSPGTKASMERIDPFVAGTIKENWKTAVSSLGLDAGANMLATPGFRNSVTPLPVSSSFVSSSSSGALSSSFASSDESVSSSVASSVSSEAAVPACGDCASSSESSSSEPSQFSVAAASSSSSSCTSDLAVEITLQSGTFSGVSKVTLNAQAIAVSGTLSGASCHFDFGDGYRSDSCNPGVHSYTVDGVYSLNLEVKNQCGNTLIQTRTVTVSPDPESAGASTAAASISSAFDDSRMVISGVLPNPDSKDLDKEWIELTNLEDHSVPLVRWHFMIGKKMKRRYSIDTVTELQAHQQLRLYQIETGYSLSNAADTVELVDPLGLVVSSVHWDKAEEGRVYKSDHFKAGSLKGTVTSVIDNTRFVMSFDGQSSLRIGQASATVRLIGLSSFDSQEHQESLYFLQSFKFIRALIENKKVELFFDSEVWDEDGSLLAYVQIDDGRILQKELILSGLSMIDASENYQSRNEYIDLQEKAMQAKSGIWSVLDPKNFSVNGKALSGRKIELISDSKKPYSPEIRQNILITEVFSSPDPKAESGGFLNQEWIEFLNTGDHDVPLQGWKLRIGKKVITFGSASILEAKKHIVLIASEVKMTLKNDGGDIILESPDSGYKVSVIYPKLRLGESYIYDESIQSYCMSKSPSPESTGICREVSVKSSVNSVKKSVAKTAKTKKSVYDSYAKAYANGLGADSSDQPIIIASEDSQIRTNILFTTIGLLIGSIGILGLLKIPLIRVILHA